MNEINPEDFGRTQDITVTILVDNRTDLLEQSTDTVKRFNDGMLLAEHGFSALIELKAEGVNILWDAGGTPIALAENMRQMEVDPHSIHKIAISHGHDDHTSGITGLLRTMGIQPKAREWEVNTLLEKMVAYAEFPRVPLVAHPAALRERWGFADDGKRFGPMYPPPYQEWSALGAELVLSEGPHMLSAGCWTTGMVPRHSFEKVGIPTRLYYRQGNEFIQDFMEDDQAVVINLKDKGLVVISGCAHAGIVNTVNYARQISGIEQVWAVLGGFHLARASQEDIQATVSAMQAIEPQLVSPCHCTGAEAIRQFAAQMPSVFVTGQVGTTYIF